MKYTRNNLSVEINDWQTDKAEFFRILAFVDNAFTEIKHPIDFAVPAPTVRISDFHYNTARYCFDVKDDTIIYLSDSSNIKDLHASLIASIVKYYAKNIYPTDATARDNLVQEVLEPLDIHLTLKEAALTSTAVVAGVLVTKKIISKLFK